MRTQIQSTLASWMSRMVDNVASILCEHEWTSRRETGRLYLECLNCRTATRGIVVGPARPLAGAMAVAPRVLTLARPRELA
jgi:hypothetical protein